MPSPPTKHAAPLQLLYHNPSWVLHDCHLSSIHPSSGGVGRAVEANQWLGYTAIFAAMFLENLFPPIPSELIMPLGGFYVQQGQLQLLPVVLAGLLGTVLGALPWYGIGRLVHAERIELWLSRYGGLTGIRPEEMGRSRKRFSRYRTAPGVWGRLVAGIRTVVLVPAGLEMMPLQPFLPLTTTSTLN